MTAFWGLAATDGHDTTQGVTGLTYCGVIKSPVWETLQVFVLPPKNNTISQDTPHTPDERSPVGSLCSFKSKRKEKQRGQASVKVTLQLPQLGRGTRLS